MKITLIRPPFVYPATQKKGNAGCPPLGLAYLAGMLKKNGYRVDCVDAFGEDIDGIRPACISGMLVNGLDERRILERILPDADLIGVSCMFTNEWFYCARLIASIRRRHPRAVIVLGGEHATADAELCLREAPGIDVVVVGEGEETLLELVRAVKSGGDFASIKGIVFAGDGGPVKTPRRERIADLSSIPWPDWDAIPLSNYLDRGITLTATGRRGLPMLASRGCPYDCTFCSSPVMWGRRWDARDAEDVIAEIKAYRSRFRIDHVDFYDLTAIVDASWIKRFCRRLIEEELGVTWALPNGTRSEALTGEVLRLLKKSGCIKLHYAPESGSKATLKRIKKEVDVARMIASIKTASQLGMITRANIVVGFPGQTWSEIASDYLFAFRLAVVGMRDIACFAFVPYPGSELHRQLVGQGLIDKSDGSYSMTMAASVTNDPAVSVSWSDHLSARQISAVIWTMVGFFYLWQFLLRPWRLVATVKRLAAGNPLTTFEFIVLGIMRQTRPPSEAFASGTVLT